MLNKMLLIGHVGKDPEVRALQSGDQMATFSIATSERWRDKATGEKKDRTQWHNIVVFNQGLVKVIEQYVKKGSKVYVEGQMLSRKWTDDKGVERTTFECVLKPFQSQLALLDRAARDDAPPADEAIYGAERTAAGQAASEQKPAAAGAGAKRADMDDEIPF